MGHQAAALTEFKKLRQDHVNLRCRKHHVVVDARQLLNLKGNRYIGVDKGTEFVSNDPLLHLDRTDLNDLVLFRTETGGLNIKDHKGIREGLALRVLYQILHVIHQVSLHAIEHLERIILIQSMACLREGLHTAMIRDSQSLHAPFLSLLDDARHIRNAIHIAHLGMTVELHALYRAVIHTLAGEILRLFDAAHRTDSQFTVKPVNGSHTAEPDEGSRLNSSI